MDEPGDSLGARARRALALMGVAAVALAVAAGLYLHATARGPAPPPPTSVSSLFWLSPQVGWVIVADSQQRSTLYHTSDGGQHWTRQFATVDSGVFVRFLDDARGIMTEPTPFPGADPTVLRSGDGGENWAPVPLSLDIGSRPNLPFFLDLEHGWVMVRTGRSDTSEDAEIFRTDDGGLDWTSVASVDPISWISHGLQEQGLKRWLSFRSTSDGYLGSLEPDGSASVYVTHDSGVDWRRVALPPPPGGWPRGDTLTLLPPDVSDDGQGTLVMVDTGRVSPPRVGRPFGQGQASVITYRTSDWGDSWDAPRLAPADVDVNLGDPAFTAGATFVDGHAGWLMAGRSAWVTTDAGRTWSRGGQLPAGRSFIELSPVDESVAVGAATMGTGPGSPWGLFLTEDAGRTWRTVPGPNV